MAAELIHADGPYEYLLPTSGGKAGRGCNKTSTIQVRFNQCVIKQVRFNVADPESRKAAVRKAKQFVDQHKAVQSAKAGDI